MVEKLVDFLSLGRAVAMMINPGGEEMCIFGREAVQKKSS